MARRPIEKRVKDGRNSERNPAVKQREREGEREREREREREARMARRGAARRRWPIWTLYSAVALNNQAVLSPHPQSPMVRILNLFISAVSCTRKARWKMPYYAALGKQF